MMQMNRYSRARIVYFLITGLLFWFSPSAFSAESCEQLLTNHKVVRRGYETPKIEWTSTKSYLEGTQVAEQMGLVQTHFSKKWDTQIYHTATGLPDAQGNPRLVDPNAEAVFVFFHGSGTAKSSGRNFLANMNTLAKLGVSGVSFDMPFHADGPRAEKFNDANYFMHWLHGIITEVKKSGKPIVLMGHSFGPDVILEYVTRFPNDVNAALALSPAGFDQVTRDWYENYTSKMNFGGDVTPNEAGGTWAGRMSDQFIWTKKLRKDPTVANPKLKLRILMGMREEYFPGPLGKNGLPNGDNTYDPRPFFNATFENAVVIREPGIGHYLFEHVDADGNHVITREVLAILGKNRPQDKKFVDYLKTLTDQVAEENKRVANSEQLAIKYASNPTFKAWADFTFGEGQTMKLVSKQKEVLAKNIMDRYNLEIKERDLKIQQEIIDTKTTAPEFYAKYKAKIDSLKPNRLDTGLFVAYLREVLQK